MNKNSESSCGRPCSFIAEELEDSVRITGAADADGFGFDATWFVDMYHYSVGVAADERAGVVARAGVGGDAPLRFDWLADLLSWTGNKTISYHISHDECGNSGSGKSNRDLRSHPTMVQVVYGAQYVDPSRQFAEARSRFAFGIAARSAGTPVFFMGEEIGALQDYKYQRLPRPKRRPCRNAPGQRCPSLRVLS